MVRLLGMGGIGKIALAVKIAQQLQNQFEYVIWYTLRNAPSLETLLSELVLFLSEQQETEAKLGKFLPVVVTIEQSNFGTPATANV
ncbi:MAG: NB-ARC domain-containing protein [Prochloraceae cyanobacterium]|nr:NB-ARC domain-containing protein [Prochloraceae cyanobacterium]